MAKLNILTGMMKLRVAWKLLQGNDEALNADIVGHKASLQAHEAAAIVYDGVVVGAGNAKEAIDSVQAQIDTLVVNGDSSAAAAQAAVDANGHDYKNLKVRLDTEHTQLSEQLTDAENDLKRRGYTPEMFGGKGGGVVDDTEAIERLIAECSLLEGKPTLYFGNDVGYNVTRGIVIPSNMNVIMDSPIIYTGTEDITVLTIGEPSKEIRDQKLVLSVQRTNVSDWTSEESIGIKIYNANQCKIDIMQTQGNTIGCQLIGDGRGFAYNHITPLLFNLNKFGLDLTNKNMGWCNENGFYGGRFAISSGIRAGLIRYGVRITSQDGLYYNNNNVFYSTSFEMNKADAAPSDAVGILIEYGNYNHFYNIRDESNSKLGIVNNQCTGNTIESGYGENSVIEDNSQYTFNTVDNLRQPQTTRKRKTVYKIDDIVEHTKFYNDAFPNTNHIKGLSMKRRSETGVYKSVAAAVARDPNYTTVLSGSSVAIGVFIDTTDMKSFALGGSKVAGYGGRPVVITYDQNGNQMTTDNKQVRGVPALAPYFVGDYGGAYTCGIDLDVPFTFVVSESVKKIWVGWTYGTNPLRIKSFELLTYSVNSSGVVYTGVCDGTKNLALKAPTNGNYKKGDIIWNDNPTSGSPMGWICLADGSPGVWQPFGIIGATKIAVQADSVATDLITLRADFNALLAKLEAAKLMQGR